jgi:hypothetical protein
LGSSLKELLAQSLLSPSGAMSLHDLPPRSRGSIRFAPSKQLPPPQDFATVSIARTPPSSATSQAPTGHRSPSTNLLPPLRSVSMEPQAGIAKAWSKFSGGSHVSPGSK